MPRPEKVQAVADIKERIENAQAVFLAEYAGLSVPQQQQLRRELKANGAEFKVVKMTLARLAAAELEIDTLDEHLLGPTGMAIADGDPVAAAKVLKDFAGENDVFSIKAGLLGRDYLAPERISELADIEPRDILLSKIAGLLVAPMGNVAGLLQALQQDTVGLVLALANKREEEAPDAATPEPADEAADAESGDDEPAEEAADGDETADADAAPEEPESAPDQADAPEASDDSAGDDDVEEPADDEDAESSSDGDSAEDAATATDADDEGEQEEAEEE